MESRRIRGSLRGRNHRTQIGILDVMASEPFDLGHGVRVRKTCSVGWAPFPWSRGAYEALCAEETIELADTALYRAKAGGRNQGVGILPGDGAAATPEA